MRRGKAEERKRERREGNETKNGGYEERGRRETEGQVGGRERRGKVRKGRAERREKGRFRKGE